MRPSHAKHGQDLNLYHGRLILPPFRNQDLIFSEQSDDFHKERWMNRSVDLSLDKK